MSDDEVLEPVPDADDEDAVDDEEDELDDEDDEPS